MVIFSHKEVRLTRPFRYVVDLAIFVFGEQLDLKQWIDIVLQYFLLTIRQFFVILLCNRIHKSLCIEASKQERPFFVMICICVKKLFMFFFGFLMSSCWYSTMYE